MNEYIFLVKTKVTVRYSLMLQMVNGGEITPNLIKVLKRDINSPMAIYSFTLKNIICFH